METYLNQRKTLSLWPPELLFINAGQLFQFILSMIRHLGLNWQIWRFVPFPRRLIQVRRKLMLSSFIAFEEICPRDLKSDFPATAVTGAVIGIVIIGILAAFGGHQFLKFWRRRKLQGVEFASSTASRVSYWYCKLQWHCLFHALICSINELHIQL